MSRFSLEGQPQSVGHQARRDYSPAPKWMDAVDKRTLESSLQSLMDAFNDLEYVLKHQIGEDNYDTYMPDYFLGQRLSSDFITIYNECEFLEENYSAKFNPKSMSYLRHLRRLCAHRFGSSMDISMFPTVIAEEIIPMKEPIRSVLLEVLKRNPETGMENKVFSFSKRFRRSAY